MLISSQSVSSDMPERRGRIGIVAWVGATWQSIVYPLGSAVVCLGIWQALVEFGAVQRFLVPPPTAIAATTWDYAGYLWSNTVVTGEEVLVGFVAASLIGGFIGIAVVYSMVARKATYPILVTAQVVPKIALAPLFVVWFGYGLSPKYIMVVLIAFFPVVLSTVAGLGGTTREMMYLAQTMGASGLRIFWRIRLPNALPLIIDGLRLAMTLAVVGAVVGEFVGAAKGLGYVIQTAIGGTDTELMFSGVFVLSLMGIVLFSIVDIIGRRIVWWYHPTRANQ